MGTLGKYLHDAREARGIDLRDAAQQTRISLQYLRALEEENFEKLPGDVFVRGFLKNYARFLRLDEAEVMKQYAEMVQKPAPAGVANQVQEAAAEKHEKPRRSSKIPVEPFVWGAGIVIILILFLHTALPSRHRKAPRMAAEAPTQVLSELSSTVTPSAPEKLYLEVFALDNTWLLVRTDSSPQKKAVLKKGESLIWSADQSFLLSYGSAGAVRLMLNGQELTVNEPKNAVVRDLTITAAGVISRKTPTEQRPERPRIKPAAAVQTKPSPTTTPQQAPSVPAPQQTPSVGSPQPPQKTLPLPPAPGKMPKRLVQ
ncbi:MAG TPA: RodZ domain-containing protein [Nitrospirota bacterium]|nr:RodZ domain-containing protein [Nitrospirota bacterium]